MQITHEDDASVPDSDRIYIRDWPYCAIPPLVADLGVPHWFARAPPVMHTQCSLVQAVATTV